MFKTIQLREYRWFCERMYCWLHWEEVIDLTRTWLEKHSNLCFSYHIKTLDVWINYYGHRANVVGNKVQEIIGMSSLYKLKNNLFWMSTKKNFECLGSWEDHTPSCCSYSRGWQNEMGKNTVKCINKWSRARYILLDKGNETKGKDGVVLKSISQ